MLGEGEGVAEVEGAVGPADEGGEVEAPSERREGGLVLGGRERGREEEGDGPEVRDVGEFLALAADVGLVEEVGAEEGDGVPGRFGAGDGEGRG